MKWTYMIKGLGFHITYTAEELPRVPIKGEKVVCSGKEYDVFLVTTITDTKEILIYVR